MDVGEEGKKIQSKDGINVETIALVGKLITWADGVQLSKGDFQKLINLRYTDTGIRSIGGMTKVNTVPYTNPHTRSAFHYRKQQPSESHILRQALPSNDSASYVEDSAVAVPGTFSSAPASLWTDSSGSGRGRFSLAPDGSVTYCNGVDNCIWGGAESRCVGFIISNDNVGTNTADYSSVISNTIQDDNNVALISTKYIFVASLRPLAGIKFYVKTPNGNASTATVSYWNGSWTGVSGLADGTASAGASLAQTGTMTFASTVGTALPKYFKGVYAYWYLVSFNNSLSATTKVYYATLSAPFQPIVDLWDGIPRAFGDFELYNGNFTDIGYKVFQSDFMFGSTSSFFDLNNLLTSNYLVVGFSERMCGLNIKLADQYVNKSTSTMTVSYWNGAAWTGVSNLDDQTSSSGVSLSRSGVVTWTPPAQKSEFPFSLIPNSAQWYYYKISFNHVLVNASSITVTTAAGSNIITGTGFSNVVLPGSVFTLPNTEAGTVQTVTNDTSVVTNNFFNTASTGVSALVTTPIALDYVSGIPAPTSILGYKFPVMFQGRVGLCSQASNKKNSVLFGSANSVSVFNGTDSYEMVFGGEEEITAAVSLFGRFGGSIYESLIVCKATETWLIAGLFGSQANPLTLYQLSDIYGCVAPQTMVVCSVASKDGVRHVVIWQSASHIVMSDTGSINPIDMDILDIFDPATPTTTINQAMINKSIGFFDAAKCEYHWLFASGNSTSLNQEYVYDLLRNRWYTTSRVSNLQCGFPVVDTVGNYYTYGTLDTGYLERLENGTDFDGNAIVSTFRLSDIPFATWGKTSIIRKIKHLARSKANTANKVSITHYGDTATSSADILQLPVTDGTHRVTMGPTVKQSLQWGPNLTHALECSITTNNEVLGYEPLGIIVGYQIAREDFI